jgi:LPPG:FO 2-phospho-L-lactate transferase
LITALAGGIGAARFLSGLIKLVDEKDLSVIVNTGDDIELFGLHISPDLDIVMYTLAGIVDNKKGWGLRQETFHCLNVLKKMGDAWFTLGDKDLATHLFRTSLLQKGCSLTEATAKLCDVFGLNVALLPMTDDKFETRIVTQIGSIHFEEYLVKRGSRDEVLGVEYVGVENARPSAAVLDSINNSELVIICPSNPIVSIGTILAVNGVRDALRNTKARKVAISPIVSGVPIKGPAGRLMRGLGLEVSAYSVAKLYSDFLDTFILDKLDASEKGRIEKLGIEVKVVNTIMRNLDEKVQLARTVLEN